MIQCVFIAIDFDKNAIIAVFDFAIQIKFRCNTENEWPETDTLHQPFDMDEIGIQLCQLNQAAKLLKLEKKQFPILSQTK
ncbi:hypothetical protein DSECCO2_544360 [anaerobic digester metagenome]